MTRGPAFRGRSGFIHRHRTPSRNAADITLPGAVLRGPPLAGAASRRGTTPWQMAGMHNLCGVTCGSPP